MLKRGKWGEKARTFKARFLVNTVIASDKLASATGYSCNPVENILIL